MLAIYPKMKNKTLERMFALLYSTTKYQDNTRANFMQEMKTFKSIPKTFLYVIVI